MVPFLNYLARCCKALGPFALVFVAYAAAWTLLFWVIPPDRQNFPLNDDWAYSRGAFAFARGEGIHYFHQPSMPLLGQWLWAFPFIRIFGESHAALRFSTILLSLLGIVAFYDLLRQETGASPGRAAFAAAALGFNPLFFLLAGTYMSDVPALAFSLIALGCYARALRSNRLSWLVPATVVAILAAITRQNTVAAPAAGMLLWWRSPQLRWHPACVLAILLPLSAGAITHSWFTARPDVIPLEPAIPSSGRMLFLTFVGVHTLGLFAIPVLLIGSGKKSCEWLAVGALVMLGAAYSIPIFATGLTGVRISSFDLYPYIGNMITPWGAFAYNNYVVPGEPPLVMGEGLQFVLTFAGCVGGGAFLARLAHRLRMNLLPCLLSSFSAYHVLFLFLSPNVFDRYLLVLVPGAVSAVLGVTVSRIRFIAGFLVLLLFALVSIGLMHDWLAWNSARWELGRRALALGIPATDIEGGFEWDGWYSPSPSSIRAPGFRSSGLTLSFNRSCFPHVTGRFALAFSQPPCTMCSDVESYRLWLTMGEHQFVLVAQEN